MKTKNELRSMENELLYQIGEMKIVALFAETREAMTDEIIELTNIKNELYGDLCKRYPNMRPEFLEKKMDIILIPTDSLEQKFKEVLDLLNKVEHALNLSFDDEEVLAKVLNSWNDCFIKRINPTNHDLVHYEMITLYNEIGRLMKVEQATYELEVLGDELEKVS